MGLDRGELVIEDLTVPLALRFISGKYQGGEFPLPGAGEIVIQGPTFRYTVDRGSGGVHDLEVKREGRVVVSLTEPARNVSMPDVVA